MKINILGLEYQIKIVSTVDRHQALWGKINYETQEIVISSNISSQHQLQTIIHELLHGILTHLGYSNHSDDEQFVTAVSAALYQSLAPFLTFYWGKTDC